MCAYTARCNVIMTPEYIVIDKGIKQQRTRLRLRACLEDKDGHFKLKL